MTRNVDDIVDTSPDPVVALVVTSSTVTREVVPLVHVEVGVHVALVCTPDGTCHTGPWLLDGENTLNIVAV